MSENKPENTVSLQPLNQKLQEACARYLRSYQASVTLNHNTAEPCVLASDSFRIFHGRGGAFDGLNWLTVDYFFPVWVITLFAPVEIHTEKNIIALLSEHVKQAYLHDDTSIVLQRRYLTNAPWEWVLGNPPKHVFAKRGNTLFNLSFTQQNIGFFLDIEPARQWLSEKACNANVLNLFSYTCAFSVVAAEAQAKSIVNIDLSRRSLDVGRQNHLINHLSCEPIRFYAHNILKSWGKLKRQGPYDIVIVDPPSFQKGSFVASKDYEKILNRLEALVNVDGYALLCLNAPEVTLQAFKERVDAMLHKQPISRFVFQESLSASPDFTEVLGSALKMLVYQRI